MISASTDDATLLDQILHPAGRPNPYPLWARLREHPVARQHDGRWVVSGYDEALAIINDPRITAVPEEPPLLPSFVMLDPPDHDLMRAQIMKHFGPPHRPGFVAGLRDRILAAADEHKFSKWTRAITELADVDNMKPEALATAQQAVGEATQYLAELVRRRRNDPGDDVISGLAHDGQMSADAIVSNVFTLLIAGHETTVNAIANGTLLLLRQPQHLETLRSNPDLVPAAFEEILRLEPPVQFRDRRAIADIEIGGQTIPAGYTVLISYAAANRDPRHFPDPDTFRLDRENTQHLAFNSGIHYCFGAPMARLEGTLALDRLLRRVHEPRLLDDPPPYRPGAALRGPERLRIGFRRITS
jgi:cytochrome P450